MARSVWYLLLLVLLYVVHSHHRGVQGLTYVGRRSLSIPEDEEYRQILDRFENLVQNKEQKQPLLPRDLDLLNALRKRQIRYHQCYFNPVSCFRRK